MKTYTYGQIQIVRDALELAHDTSYDGENNRKIRGAIDLLDMPLDAFEEVYRLKDEVKRLTAENLRLAGEVSNRNSRALAGDTATKQFDAMYEDIERLTAERDEVREALRIMLLQNPYQDGEGGHRYQACQMAQEALDHVPDVGKMVCQGEQK